MNITRNRIIIISIITALITLLIFSFLFVSVVGSFNNRLRVPLTMDQAAKLAENHLESLGNGDLAIDEIMEFQSNFYIVYYEKSTGVGAFEAIIDKVGTGMGGMMRMMMGYGYVRPEQGPNIMWNTKYGMHGGIGGIGWMHGRNTYNNTSITGEQAKEYAQKYLDQNFSGTMAEDVHPFYGYYTVHVMKEDKIFGMLSVNSYNGEVWYHNWHGTYIQTLEF